MRWLGWRPLPLVHLGVWMTWKREPPGQDSRSRELRVAVLVACGPMLNLPFRRYRPVQRRATSPRSVTPAARRPHPKSRDRFAIRLRTRAAAGRSAAVFLTSSTRTRRANGSAMGRAVRRLGPPGKESHACGGTVRPGICAWLHRGSICAQLCELPGRAGCPSGLVCSAVDIEGYGVCY